MSWRESPNESCMPNPKFPGTAISAGVPGMKLTSPTRVQAKVISALCVFVLGSILVAGLWPFHISRNAVSWLKDENGLRFDGHGAVVSAGAFRPYRAPNDTRFTLELWLIPARTHGGGTFLAFDSSPDPRSPFKLSQFSDGLAVQRYSIDEQGKVHQFWFKVTHVFEAGQRVFVTITSNKNGTDLYLDGVLAGTSPDPGIASRELTGRLVLANSTYDDSWKGAIAGLAIYGRELTPAEVSSHFQHWSSSENPNEKLNPNLSMVGEPVIALYRFDERAGNTIHNWVDPTTDLTIPARYFVLHRDFLRQDLYPQAPGTWTRWSSWADLAINIGGFILVGFAFTAYFSRVKPISRAALTVVTLGLLLSLAVEVSQSLLPNRDSGMADLITNTTGTALGVLLYRWRPLQSFWTRILEYFTSTCPLGVRSLRKSSADADERLTLSK